MFDETRRSIRRALDLGKILFSLGPERFERLVSATSKIKSPTKEDLDNLMKSGISLEEAVGTWFMEAYSNAAMADGFTKEQGKAMLSYAAMLKDLEE
jgi:hypothetical protein